MLRFMGSQRVKHDRATDLISDMSAISQFFKVIFYLIPSAIFSFFIEVQLIHSVVLISDV